MRALWLVPVLALSLTACGSNDPVAERRGDVESVVLAANDGDAGAVRQEVEELLSTIRRQVANGELDRAEGERLRVIALRIAEQAALLDPEPTPSPTPVEEEPEPEPTEEEPEPEPTEEEPEPEPTEEEPEPEPTEEPEPSEEPVIEITPASDPSPSPTAASAQSSPRPTKKAAEPSASPAR